MSKKIFISVPMAGRTKEQVFRDLKIAREFIRRYIDADAETFDGWVESDPTPDVANAGVYYLAKSLEVMSRCDSIFMCVYPGCNRYKGCWLEYRAAIAYGLEEIDKCLCYTGEGFERWLACAKKIDAIDQLSEKITDMTLQGASEAERAAAIKESMSAIDAINQETQTE